MEQTFRANCGLECTATLRTATHCNTLQRTASHCNSLQLTATQTFRANCGQHDGRQTGASYCRSWAPWSLNACASFVMRTVTTALHECVVNAKHGNMRQCTSTRSSTRQYTATLWTCQHTIRHCNTLQHTAHTATRCITTQHEMRRLQVRGWMGGGKSSREQRKDSKVCSRWVHHHTCFTDIVYLYM